MLCDDLVAVDGLEVVAAQIGFPHESGEWWLEGAPLPWEHPDAPLIDEFGRRVTFEVFTADTARSRPAAFILIGGGDDGAPPTPVGKGEALQTLLACRPAGRGPISEREADVLVRLVSATPCLRVSFDDPARLAYELSDLVPLGSAG